MDAAQHVRARYLPLSGIWLLALLVAASVVSAHGGHIPTTQAHNRHARQIHQGTGSIRERVHGDGSHAAGAMRQLSELTSRSRVIVVNDIPGHYEVLAGVLHVLNSLNVKPHVLYVGAPNTPVTWGLLSWLGEEPTPEWDQLPLSWPSTRHDSAADGGATGSGAEGQVNHTVVRVLEGQMATWHPMKMIESLADENLSAELVLCVSAELAPDVCRSVVEAVKPHQLVVVLHRADALSLNAKVLTLHRPMDMFALAPHVARMSEFKMRVPVGWALPTAPLVPKRGGCMQLACLDGFTVQGALRRYRNKNASGYTRNYLQLWARLLDLKQHHLTLAAGGAAPVVRVAVLGKGDRSALGIPPDLEADISFHSKLPYQEFWGRIHRSLALVPSLGHAEYYLSRITSTVLASLITTTPIIADKRFMDVYDFLGPEHVFLRLPEEDEASAMYRIASMPESEVISRRAALQTLRQTLNQRTRTLFGQWLERARF